MKNDEIIEPQSTEVVNMPELENEAIDTIVALVNHAKTIKDGVSSSNDFVVYYDVKEATTYIKETDEKSKAAREKYNDLKEMPQAHWYTIGRNKAKAELSQEVLGEVIDAVDNNANATKALFNAQTKMAEFSNKLYAIGLMGIASNRMVVRQIKLRLENASKEELSELARQELEKVIYELELQQNISDKVDLCVKKNNETNERCVQLAKSVEENQADFLGRIEAVNNVVNQLETELNEANEKRVQLSEQVDESHKDFLKRIEVIENAVNDIKEQMELRTKEADKKIEENYVKLMSFSAAHENRLNVLEKKSFFDSIVYKIFVGVVALCALILSLVSF